MLTPARDLQPKAGCQRTAPASRAARASSSTAIWKSSSATTNSPSCMPPTGSQSVARSRREPERTVERGIAQQDHGRLPDLRLLERGPHERGSDATPLTVGKHPDRAERQDRRSPPEPAHLHVADDIAVDLGHERQRPGLVANGLDDRRLQRSLEGGSLDLDRGGAIGVRFELTITTSRSSRSRRRPARTRATRRPIGSTGILTTTNCAMRSPRAIFTASALSRFTADTITSPR